MKKFVGYLSAFSLLLSPAAYAQVEEVDETYYTEEDDELFNRGKFVGRENNDYQIRIRRERTKNWTIALTSTAAAIAAVFFAGKDHSFQTKKITEDN